jgi:hypothetical protein
MKAYLTQPSSNLAHPYRPDRARSGHLASILRPITLTIATQEIVVQVQALQDCPDQVRDHYTAEELDGTIGQHDHWFLISSGSLVFWTMYQDYLHVGLSLREVKESLEMVYRKDWEECPF